MSEQWEKRQGQEVGKVKVLGDTVVFISNASSTDAASTSSAFASGGPAVPTAFKFVFFYLTISHCVLCVSVSVFRGFSYIFCMNNQTFSVCFRRGFPLDMEPMAIGKKPKSDEPTGHDFVVNNNKLQQTLAVCCEGLN